MSSQPLIKPSAWLFGESLDLMNFIAEKSKTAVEPLRIPRLCDDFIEEYGSQTLRSTLESRLRMTLRPKIPEIEGLDTETKAKMMFVLSATVDSVFLGELQAAGVVILDQQCRIIRFLTHNGDMVCSGKHKDTGSSGTEREAGKDDEILDFLCRISERDPQPMTLIALAKKYKIETSCVLSESTLAARLSEVRKSIYYKMRFAKNIRIRMMFVTGVTLNDKILEELRKYATVETDEDKRITAYKAHNNSLQLKGKPLRRSGLASRAESPSPGSNHSSQSGSRTTRSGTRATGRTCLNRSRDPVPRKQARREPPACGLAGFTKDPDDDEEDESPPREKSPPTPKCWRSMEVEYSTPNGTSHKKSQLTAQIKKERVSSPMPTYLKMEIPEETSGFRSSVQGSQMNTPNSSVIITEPSDEEASAKDYLLMLRSIVRSLDSFILDEINGQIEQAIETIGEKKVLIPDLLTVLKSGLLIFEKSAKSEEISEDSTSLKEFLLILRSGLFAHRTSLLNNFRTELKIVIDELQAKDKALSIQCIRSVLETLLHLINA